MTATTLKLPDSTKRRKLTQPRPSMLLNLPQEILDQITASLLKDVGFTGAGDARLVCSQHPI